MQFELLLILGLLAAGVLLIQRRFTEALWLVFLAHSSLTSVRHAPLYALIAAPEIAIQLTGLWKQATSCARHRSVGRILFQLGEDLRPAFLRTSLWAGASVLALALVNGPVPWPRDFPSEAFPVNLIHRNQKILAQGRVFTTDQWGDYLIYSSYPSQKVFIDGRSDFYGEAIGRDYLAMLEGSYRALPIVRQRGFDVMLLPVEWPLSEMMKNQPGWKVLEDDGHAILFSAEASQSVKTLAAHRILEK